MYLIDTSIWIDVFRDRTQARAAQLKARIGGRATVLCRFTQLELRQGAKDQQEWELLDSYLSEQRWQGEAWVPFAPIADHGTADFHPRLATFADGSAVAAWEDVNAVLPDTAALEDMAAVLEISVGARARAAGSPSRSRNAGRTVEAVTDLNFSPQKGQRTQGFNLK